jgi:fucose 4-O-acetylase-like acetyltransferase
MEVKVDSGQRIDYIDLAKGFCIIFVVMNHVSDYYKLDFWINDFITAFRMPLYYFLSGVFFKTYNGFSNFLKKKTNKLLIPFLFFYFTTSLPLKWLSARQEGGISFFDLLTGVYHESFSNSAIWFLLSLFIVNLLFYLIFSVSTSKTKHSTLFIVLFSMIVGLSGLLLSYFKINIPLYIDTSLTALPFFMAGFVVKKYTKLLIPNNLDKYTFFVILLCFAIVGALSDGRVIFIDNVYSPRSYFTLYPLGLLGTIGVLYCAKFLNHVPFISYLGRYSIMVLVTHLLFFPRLKPLISSIFGGEMVEMQFVVNFVLTLLLCFALIPIMKRLLPHVTAQKDVLK